MAEEEGLLTDLGKEKEKESKNIDLKITKY
jgi:hypothetical protein